MSKISDTTTNFVRLAILYFAMFFAGTVLAQTDDLKGCWLRIKTANRISGNVELSDLKTVTSTCYRRFDEVVITNTCAESNRRELEQYRIPSNGKLETRTLLNPEKWLNPATHGQLKEVEQWVEFYPRSYELSNNELTIFYPSLVQRNLVASIEVLRRVEPTIDEACQPPQLLVSKEEFSRYFMIPQLVAAHADRTLRPFFAMAFSKEKLGSIPEKAIRPEHVRRLLEEFDKATGELSAPIRKRLENNPQSLVDAFFANYQYDPASDRNLAGIEKQQWAKDTARELLEVGKLSAYLAIIGPVYKDVLGKASSGPDRIDKGFGIGDTYILDRELLQSGVYELLPEGMLPGSRDSLVALRELSVRNNELAKSRRYFPPLKLDDALGKATNQILEKEKTELAGIEKSIREKLALVATRFSYTLDPREMGRCKIENIDPISAAASNGDWKLARKASGEAIVQGSIEHSSLFSHYYHGCSSPRDFTQMRRILEDIAAAPLKREAERALRSDVKYCILARWTRYGVGGERNAQKATEYEKRFRSEAYFVSIEPTDAEIAHLRTQYPERIAQNFLCPSLTASTSIDPRDPWSDLR